MQTTSVIQETSDASGKEEKIPRGIDPKSAALGGGDHGRERPSRGDRGRKEILLKGGAIYSTSESLLWKPRGSGGEEEREASFEACGRVEEYSAA